MGPRIVSLRVFDRYHDVPPFGNGHDPRGRIGVEIAQVGTIDDETFSKQAHFFFSLGGLWESQTFHSHRVAAQIALIRDEDVVWARRAVPR